MTENDYKKILKDRQIKYRGCLNISNDITFGIEIEYENIINDLVTHLLDDICYYNPNFKNWKNKPEIDLSVIDKIGQLVNGEINSPILKDNVQTWQSLKTVLDVLKKYNAIITNRCGGHVNIGAHILGYNTEYWRNFLLLWILYEREIYKFSSGEFCRVRVRNDNIIGRIAPILKNNIDIILNSPDMYYKNIIFDYLKKSGASIFEKTHDISLSNFISSKYKEDNRIEFRVPNGTLSKEIWQNYINFFVKFLLACKKELDVDKIIYKINNNEHSIIELADYVFDDNIDKDNFLIQTFKTNNIYKKQLPNHIFYIL